MPKTKKEINTEKPIALIAENEKEKVIFKGQTPIKMGL